MGSPNQTTPLMSNHKAVPFQSAILGGIAVGKTVRIQGQAHSNAGWFAVNFICSNNDIAFHFNPRFSDGNVTVCNTKQGGDWGAEERRHKMPFKQNTYFDITITVMGHAFQSDSGTFYSNHINRGLQSPRLMV
ncbi:hypothetical protein GDO78_017484 [Eleutherodactylus coqui]|uniref:Galectin n=1 Tax=Eleutherodactylus coqui TaxID=57060 RepID=A0A8J6BA27_ELECQ|nr:hypothetical protein GDO78_017484 [Eleutherodactylus coqui]